MIGWVSRIKALLKAHQDGTIPKPKNKRKSTATNDQALVVSGEDDAKKVPGKPDEYVEMQDGWLECYTEDGYTYYFNPKTDESLWDLPASLKIPVADDESVRLIDTPRSLMNGELAEEAQPEPPRMIAFKSEVVVDQTEVMDNVIAEAKAIAAAAAAAAAAAVEIALNITSFIRANVLNRPRPTCDSHSGGDDVSSASEGNSQAIGYTDTDRRSTKIHPWP